MSQKLLAILMGSLMLAACGGGDSPKTSNLPTPGANIPESSPQKGLTNGVASSTWQNAFGRPQDSKAVASMAQRLATYFDGKHALGSDPASSAAAANTKAWEAGRKASSFVPRAVYRFLNTQTGVHFFTASPEERDWVVANLPQFHLEGPAFFALPAGGESLTPVYRFYNKVSGTHFYTVSAAERDAVLGQFPDIFNLDGISWYASGQLAAGWQPIYRFFNTLTGTHFYTASAQERDNIRNSLSNYVYEGVGYYVRASETPFVPVANPQSCTSIPAPLLSGNLPAHYSATLILKTSAMERPFLNNRGDVAFMAYDQAQGRMLVHYWESGSGALTVLFPPGSDLLPYGDATAYTLLSLGSHGELLMRQGNSMDLYDQNSPLVNMPDAVMAQNGAVTPISGLKIPSPSNHRAGRLTFLEAIGGVGDGSGRQWAFTSAQSYLDGGAISQTANSLYLANRPAAVNHCAWGLDMSGRTENGLYWMNGKSVVEQWGFQFAYGQNDSLRILGTNNRRAVVGYSEGFPIADKISGYLKYGPAQERVFENFILRDVNENLVAIGDQVAISDSNPPPVITIVDGFIFTVDGQPQSVKGRVLSLNQVGTRIQPLKINDSQQILAQVELNYCDLMTNTNSRGDACGSKYIYLLSPQ